MASTFRFFLSRSLCFIWLWCALTATASRVGAQQAAQPDVAVSRLDEAGLVVGYQGEGEISPKPQQIEAVWSAGDSPKFALQITNKSSAASEFELKAATLPAGWNWKFFDALAGGTLLKIGDKGLITPVIAPGKSLT